MPGALRVFVSSTMVDLANERAAVVDQLREFGFEAVNAEAIPSSGEGSWAILESEIQSCEAFVLILGERYGWIPFEGRARRKDCP
ncbi:hypothetical protein BST36_29985 [Mycolicibacterium moriokaense]|uniref:DUF4062 domain-containing protein n=1 Tax=Mycolicibacterium moriokaense TaxID=39691 RepID=A0AAD1HH97_9MYCO|nr:DUF4062 domain-containing protein [Mycolicibacterium moriokaense]MCV7039208.1 DUF4062 domain-containing protein [Mycolicibacterium moriokaense]ORB12586.1 hypothetical protein BST36_29985 [Mycolicibacterium moriokaense]BBX04644.1 hypothetical protein MMOR_55800 [Mycolicibacterium moriokaense]